MYASRRRFLKTLGLSATLGATVWPLAACRPRRQKTVSGGPLVASVRDLGVQFRGNPVDITGQDGATSVLLPDGNAFWAFGDTIEGPFETIRHHSLTDVLSNTGGIVPRQDPSHGLKHIDFLKSADGKRARQLVAFADDEDKAKHRLWTIHGACVGADIYLFYHKIEMDPVADVFETFELKGMGIARARIGTYDFKRLVAPDGTREFWKGDVPGFGVFIEKLPDGYLYLWGSYWTGMFLARTRPETIARLESYEYLVEAPTHEKPDVRPRWSSTFEPTAALFDHVPNEMSAAYNPYLKKHVAIHTFLRENKVLIRTAPKITGPWSEPEVFHRPEKIRDDDLFSAAKEHPELARKGGKVLYVTYVNSTVYMPHLLEVTLA